MKRLIFALSLVEQMMAKGSVTVRFVYFYADNSSFFSFLLLLEYNANNRINQSGVNNRAMRVAGANSIITRIMTNKVRTA